MPTPKYKFMGFPVMAVPEASPVVTITIKVVRAPLHRISRSRRLPKNRTVGCILVISLR